MLSFEPKCIYFCSGGIGDHCEFSDFFVEFLAYSSLFIPQQHEGPSLSMFAKSVYKAPAVDGLPMP